MSQTPPEPRLLLVEDDPISRSFLHDALSALPAEVDVASDIAEAVVFVLRGEHALWLVDAHLPDGDGLDCLRAMRDLAPSPTPALAITAGVAREELDALCAGGFLEVLLKPVSVAALQSTVQRVLRRAAARVREPQMQGKLPLWDEGRALAALGGNRAALDKLRGMFQAELPELLAQLSQCFAGGDSAGLRAILHKLKASCGFVGAARMLQAVNALAESPSDTDAWLDLQHAASDAQAWSRDQP